MTKTGLIGEMPSETHGGDTGSYSSCPMAKARESMSWRKGQSMAVWQRPV